MNMNLIKIFFTMTLFFITPNLGNCSNDIESIEIPVETQDMGNASKHVLTIDPKVKDIGVALSEFRYKYPQFDYGVDSMFGLYDTIANPKDLYEEMVDHAYARKFLFCCEFLTGGACEVVKCLSVFHPSTEKYGEALTGLYVAKSIFWGIDSWLNSSARQKSIGVINALQADPQIISHVSTASSQVDNINCTPIIKIANAVIKLAKSKDLPDTDKEKLDRLTDLSKKIGKTDSFKTVFSMGGKILSFLTGAATGITVAVTGQTSTPSYYLTLVAGGLDSIVDSVNTTMTTKPIVQKYITISEIIYLSDYFLDEFGNEVEV